MHRFEELEAFVLTVEAGTFTGAAERLEIAKSAVSRRIASLEERLGVQLLRRTTRRMNLTQTGQAFYEHGTRILADLEEAESAVMQAHGTLRGRLRVGLPLSFGLHHMSAPVAEFSRLHPDVEFDLDLNDRRIDLLQEDIDVAIRIGKLADSTLIARKLFDAKTVLCAAPAYLERAGTPKVPADLRKHACLGYSNLADPHHWVCHDAGGNSHGVRVELDMTVNSGDFLCAAATAGLGIVMQPTFIACEAIRRGELEPVLADFSWPVTPAYAVYPPTRHLSYRVRAFIDFLVARFSGTPPWDKDCGVCG